MCRCHLHQLHGGRRRGRCDFEIVITKVIDYGADDASRTYKRIQLHGAAAVLPLCRKSTFAAASSLLSIMTHGVDNGVYSNTDTHASVTAIAENAYAATGVGVASLVLELSGETTIENDALVPDPSLSSSSAAQRESQRPQQRYGRVDW
ncbi:hypothetical protein ON010_g9694 [Phytophthora cinnamomi]|nr:hypothetical protein ON010_g9694 [Phytophthora cinnamomi]